uniref:Uncharacterized protein n=1 Tax=Panagrolaimus sp. ES5 TaxID=591445 RepID=A0AC34GKB7_9BILA
MVGRSVELVLRGENWFTTDDVPFDRLPGHNVQKWPLLLQNGQIVDTMYAQKKPPAKGRSQWKYFVITRDGVRLSCSKD